MYIWEVEIEVLWTYEEEGEADEVDSLVVASANFEGACKKAKDICLKNNPKFKDDENPKVTHGVKKLEIIKVERKDWIDG